MCDISSLISRDALVKSLKSLSNREDVQLLDGFQVERGSSGVEGFSSIVLRVRLSYRLPGDNEIYSHVFFVKALPQFEQQREFVKTARVFSKEWIFFSQVVPMMAKVSAGRIKVPLPTCYHSTGDDDNAAFYMEDLVDSGYRSANRSYILEGLDYAHCSLVMKGLGRLHALSLASEKTLDPGKGGWGGSFPDLGREYLFYIPCPGDPPSPLQNMIDSMIQNTRDLAKEMDGLPKEAEASGALDRVLEGVWPTICRLKETPAANRRVLIHGDCWMNNIMFKYEKGAEGEEGPVDVKFFDLQGSKVCHPGIDILNFIYLSTRRPFREKYFTALIDEYHKSLTENLKILDGSSPPFSLNELMSDLMGEYKPFGVFIGMLISPTMMLGDELMLPNVEDMTAEKMEDFFDTGNTSKIKVRFHKDPKFRFSVEDIVREFLDMALPSGLESVNLSPLLVQSVNKISE